MSTQELHPEIGMEPMTTQKTQSEIGTAFMSAQDVHSEFRMESMSAQEAHSEFRTALMTTQEVHSEIGRSFRLPHRQSGEVQSSFCVSPGAASVGLPRRSTGPSRRLAIPVFTYESTPQRVPSRVFRCAHRGARGSRPLRWLFRDRSVSPTWYRRPVGGNHVLRLRTIAARIS